MNTTTDVQSIEQARTIAANWQSPGAIGRTLAAFASGAPVDWAELIEDAQATIRNDQPSGENLAELQALIDWATAQTEPAPVSKATVHDRVRVALVTEGLVSQARLVGGRDAVIRYASEILAKRAAEGRMDRDDYTQAELQELVTGVLADEPGMLTWSSLTVAARATARQLSVTEYVERAREASRQGGKPAAVRILRHAARLDPDMKTAATRGRTVADVLRAFEEPAR